MSGGGEVNDAEEKGRRERRMDLIDMVGVVVVYRIVKEAELRKKLGGMTFLLFSAGWLSRLAWRAALGRMTAAHG